jgi:tetratricopeptide (TPR) repeat protein
MNTNINRLITRVTLLPGVPVLAFIFFMFPCVGFSQDMESINLANEYYQTGQLEKARELYDRLVRKSENIPLIHSMYFELLLGSGDFDQASKHIERMIRENPGNKIYLVDKGIILKRKGDGPQEAEYFKKFIREISIDGQQSRFVAQYFIKKQMFDYAMQTYLMNRAASNDALLYSLELANLYRILNNKEEMISEYLNFASQNPNNISYVKNVLQSSLQEDGDIDKIETELIARIQKEPDNKIFSDLLIWVNVQKRNFYGAFIQARAYDRRFERNGNKILEVGFLALENKAFDDAVQIFDFLCNNYSNTYLYPIARRYKIQSREEYVRNTYPVNLEEIRKLANDYEGLTSELGIGPTVAEAMFNKAHLHAFYLSEIDSAIGILNLIVRIPKIHPDLIARCKLVLGDIYILAGEPWESSLLYAQVEKSRKDTPVGYEAKLKNAKLMYFKGDFLLAQEQLDVLKLATSREIANDAMHLSIFIKDNIGLDTSDFLLKKFAGIELMLFRNRKSEALDSLIVMNRNYIGSSLTDDILWQISKIQIEMGRYNEAIENLQIINSNYSADILGDDALYRMGEVYEFYIKDMEKAKEIYRELLTKYPGSMYTSDARKKFRILRGDAIN